MKNILEAGGHKKRHSKGGSLQINQREVTPSDKDRGLSDGSDQIRTKEGLNLC